jgi:transposase
MERLITMSTKELGRAEILSKLKQKAISQLQAAEILGISNRQVRRLYREYKKMGARALISRKRGKPSNHQLPRGLVEWSLALIREHYPDFGPTLAHEKLLEQQRECTCSNHS